MKEPEGGVAALRAQIDGVVHDALAEHADDLALRTKLDRVLALLRDCLPDLPHTLSGNDLRDRIGREIGNGA